MIVGLVSSSRAVPLSRELDPLLRSEVHKPLRRIGRTKHLAGLGLATRGFKARAHARFLGRMSAPGRPGEPQSTGGEQRGYCQGQMFCFHCLLRWFELRVHFRYGMVRGFPGVGLRFGTKAGNRGVKRQQAGMNHPQPSPLNA